MFEKAAKEFDKKEKEKDLERNNGQKFRIPVPIFDKEMFGQADLRGNDDDVLESMKKKVKNFSETQSPSPIKKLGSIHNF